MQERLESAKADDEIDIKKEKLTSTTNGAFIVNKAVKIKNGDVSGSVFEIKVAGVTFENVKGAKQFLVAEDVGEGDFTVTNCGDVKYLIANGGGSNSIHITSTKISNATANKEGVRILLKDKQSQIENITINKPCILESDTADTSFSRVSVASGVDKVTLRGKTKIDELVVASSRSKILVGSSDVGIEKAGGEFTLEKESAVTEIFDLPQVKPLPINPAWKLWLDDAYLKEGGTAVIDDFTQDSITVTASETPTRHPWDANLNFWYKLEQETQYLIEFDAKFDGEQKETTFNMYDGTQQKNVAVAPFNPTSEWKRYTFMIPVYSDGAADDFPGYLNDEVEFSFRLTKGTLSVKDFKVYNCWADDFIYNDLNKWDLWFKAGSGATVMMYDVSETAAKANRRLECDDVANIEAYMTNVGYKMNALSAGNYRFLVRSNGGPLHTLNVHIASDNNDKELGQATGFDGEGLYYVDFTVPEKQNDKNFVMQFWFNPNDEGEWQESRLDVSEIAYGSAAALEIPAGAKNLTYTPNTDTN